MNEYGRKTVVINLDPANDALPYEAVVDISDFIKVQTVMEERRLGPNAALLYCMQRINENFEWLSLKLETFKDCYLLFDCPGQVELHTHDTSLKSIVQKLVKAGFHLATVHLIDSTFCSEPSKFISALLLSLKVMMFFELPHLNVLSKLDIIESMGKLDFNIDFYTDVLDLKYLSDKLNESINPKYHKMTMLLCEMIQEFSLVSFQTLAIEDKESVFNLMCEADKCNGYIFGAASENNESIIKVAVAEKSSLEKQKMTEKYVHGGSK